MNKCGDCYYWMKKSDCPREKGFQKGGPSCNSPACSKFKLDEFRGEIRKKEMKTKRMTIEELEELFKIKRELEKLKGQL